ncbi:MAG TPA: IS3 family transposase [Labilithrix sp.]|nr:IS3 family transposase [Labilithrix sp.]
MMDHTLPELSVRRQCELLKVSRSGLYYESEPSSPDDLALMRRIDELHLKYPLYGSRKLSDALRKEGREANRKRIQRLIRLMGLEAMAPKPTTSEPHPEHVRYPYLLRGLAIFRVNQVWATDITYIPMKAGFVYLVAIIDWYSRRVLSWRLSNTLDSRFCVDALDELSSASGSRRSSTPNQGAAPAQPDGGASEDRYSRRQSMKLSPSYILNATHRAPSARATVSSFVHSCRTSSHALLLASDATAIPYQPDSAA